MAELKLIAEQLQASNPYNNVWVTANAGSGKTSVLTNRFIRLMLAGCPPDKILCITYTNAGAAEMKEKLFEKLAKISFAEDSEKSEQLHNILGQTPTTTELENIQKIYLELIDRPDKIKIQTIHSLCQSILKKFSIEAGVQPYFNIIDEVTKQELISESFSRLYSHNLPENKYVPEIMQSLQFMAQNFTDTAIKESLTEIISASSKFQNIINSHGDISSYCKYLEGKLDANLNEAEIINHFYNNYKTDLKYIADEFAKGGVKTTELAEGLYKYLEQQGNNFKLAYDSLIKDDGEARKFGNLNLYKNNPILQKAVNDAQFKALEINDKLKTKFIAKTSIAAAYLGYCIIEIYETLKDQRACLDYDDLINKTVELLTQKEAAAWVLFKLDGGLQHILVDEAQDTSHPQWQIVNALTEEFFSSETNRTVFVVGDEKQSIFGFQGADIENFYEQKREYIAKTAALKNSLNVVRFKKSFRSLPIILDVVDKVFEGELKQSVTDDEQAVNHISERDNKGFLGYFEFNKHDNSPAKKRNSDKEPIKWHLPEQYALDEEESQKKKLADKIVTRVKTWLDERRTLPALGRAIKPSDIMILLRSRDDLYKQICYNLQQNNIKVSAVSKIKTNDEIATLDLLSFASFLVLPSDDLNLACLLKSPVFNYSEDELFELAYNRGAKTLFETLLEKQTANAKNLQSIELLKYFLDKLDFHSITEIFTELLDVKGIRANFYKRLGKETKNILDEFLNFTQTYEANYNAGMQGFVHWFKNSNTEVKSSVSNAEDEVQVLTAHASKGLEAPIVIIANAAKHSKPNQNNKNYFFDDYILTCTAKEFRNSAIENEIAEQAKQENHEANRLLYVALTRAKDELYIYSITKNAEAEGTWYNSILKAAKQFKPAQNTKIIESDEQIIITDDKYLEIYSATNSDKNLSANNANIIDYSKYKYLNTPINFATKTEVYSPSELDEEAKNFIAKNAESTEYNFAKYDFERGKIIHKLFENLPKLAPERHFQYAKNIFDKSDFATELNFEEIYSEAQNNLNNPEFAFLFASNTLAEVPIIGEFEGKFYSGKIDKLVITESEILIIDFKTNRDIPNAKTMLKYKNQLNIYKHLVQNIYPSKPIKTAILWSSKNKLEYLD